MKPLLTVAIAVSLAAASAAAQTPEAAPGFLRDRGPGVPTSMFGTYVEKGQLLVYPFFEWYADRNLEYTPAELGFGLPQEYRGRYRAAEGLIFLGYGVTSNLAVEMEAAVIAAELRKPAADTSALPARFRETSLPQRGSSGAKRRPATRPGRSPERSRPAT